LVRLGGNDTLVVRTIEAETRVTEKDEDGRGRKVIISEPIEITVRRVYKLDKIKVQDATGKAIEVKTLPDHINREVAALVTHRQDGVNPFHLSLYKTDTLLFILPPTPETEEVEGRIDTEPEK
jgi:hypothetical protein